MDIGESMSGDLAAAAAGLCLRTHVGAVLSIPATLLDDETALTDLGINLVLGGKIRHLVLQDLGLTLPAVLLFGGGSVRDLEHWAFRQLNLATDRKDRQ